AGGVIQCCCCQGQYTRASMKNISAAVIKLIGTDNQAIRICLNHPACIAQGISNSNLTVTSAGRRHCTGLIVESFRRYVDGRSTIQCAAVDQCSSRKIHGAAGGNKVAVGECGSFGKDRKSVV